VLFIGSYAISSGLKKIDNSVMLMNDDDRKASMNIDAKRSTRVVNQRKVPTGKSASRQRNEYVFLN